MAMNRRRLPIGMQAFRNLRNKECYYVDKTPHIERLVDEGEYYFLSRPRRFGKSLLISTLKELFEGNEKLFRGLYIHDRWDWNTRHPVVRLSFGGQFNRPGILEKDIMRQLRSIERYQGLDPDHESDTGAILLRSILDRLNFETDQQVVVLVDEYDKPILDVLENRELAQANRDYLRGFYGIIKDCADYIRFVFVTGISMYSKVSLFPGLNNLYDLSLAPDYATICGYTDDDLQTVFEPELVGVEKEEREEIQRWYNGYHWLGKEKVYNPFDILLYFKNRKFKPHWYETGTPDFLYHRMKEGSLNTLDLENLAIFDRELSNFDIERINLNALLFQCGYLTIVKEEMQGSSIFYTLDYPNHEVRLSLNGELLEVVGDLAEVSERGKALVRLLESNDFEGFERQLKAFFASMPYQWRGGSDVDMARFEGYYASILYACFFTLDFDVRVEESTRRGRSDMVLMRKGQVFVLELKVADGSEVEAKAEQALIQMRDKDYAGKCRTGDRRIHLLAVVFDRQERNLALVRVEGA